jgi:hypothetical protein
MMASFGVDPVTTQSLTYREVQARREVIRDRLQKQDQRRRRRRRKT